MKMVDILTTTEEDTGVVFRIHEESYRKWRTCKNFRIQGGSHYPAGRHFGLEE